MSYLIRKTDTFLRNWKKNPDRYPLIIKGARQVGKTETIRKFAKENYKNLSKINFITEPAYKTIIDEGFSADNILKLISRIDPSKHFDAGETLLFFDEIQDFPEIATSLKFFKESGKYDVICSGSLLGVQYHRIASISVGYKTDYQMYSMDFEEFLWAKGYQEQVISDMLEHMLSGIPFSASEQNTFSNLFLEFIKQGYGLYYYSKENSTLEEDFFIRSANELIPVEVKSNTNRSKSMAQLIKSDTYPDIRHGIKFTTGNIGISDDIITFPYFCTFLLKRYMEMQKIFK